MKLEIRGVDFGYRSHPTLKGITVSIKEGEVASIVGPNGSGKTTLLKCINKILKPRKGVILIDGKDIARVGFKELARKLGYVSQSVHPSFPLSVFDTVLLGRRPYISWGVTERDKEIASQMLVALGLERLAFRPFNELSSGEKQKVLLARALAQEPEVLLLDEPTSNLDIKHQLEVLSLVTSLAREKNLSVIMAIHDLNLASRYSDKIILLKEGRIYAIGGSQEVIVPANIKLVYDVEAIVNTDSGKPFIIPVLDNPRVGAMRREIPAPGLCPAP